MVKINLKPISVNVVWRGKRFKTPAYKLYEEELLWKLPNIEIPEGKLKLEIEFGLSSKIADWDNPIKPFQDVLQKKYNFDDRRVYQGIVTKTDVRKGKEFINFKISKYETK